MGNLEDAKRELQDAIKKHGAGSEEAVAAQGKWEAALDNEPDAYRTPEDMPDD